MSKSLASAVPAEPGAASVLPLVQERSAEIIAALEPLGATKIAVFGSVARGEDHANSDVDLLVDLSPDVGLFALLRMRQLAEQILQRPVDIVPRSGIKASMVDDVVRESLPL